MHGLIVDKNNGLPCSDGEEGTSVIYKGVQFSVMATAEPDVWEWRFELDGRVKTGRTQTRLAALAVRRVETKIDAALRAARAAESTRPK
jgi:hypothetical protein